MSTGRREQSVLFYCLKEYRHVKTATSQHEAPRQDKMTCLFDSALLGKSPTHAVL